MLGPETAAAGQERMLQGLGDRAMLHVQAPDFTGQLLGALAPADQALSQQRRHDADQQAAPGDGPRQNLAGNPGQGGPWDVVIVRNVLPKGIRVVYVVPRSGSGADESVSSSAALAYERPR
jgi:hypothetical protein